jgi:hypothetical protein
VTNSELNVGEIIRRRAKTVRAAEVASVVDNLHVLDMSTIRDLIKEAIDEAKVLVGPQLGDREKQRILQKAEEGFQQKMGILQAEKLDLEGKIGELQNRLATEQQVLEEERKKVISTRQFTISEEGLVEFESRFDRVLRRAAQRGTVQGDLEEEIRRLISKVLDEEREKIEQQLKQAHSQKIALLEKKIDRLSKSLDRSLEERDRAQQERADALEALGNFRPGAVMTPGLKDSDPYRKRKLDVLKAIVDHNRDIRKALVESGRLPQRRDVASVGQGRV